MKTTHEFFSGNQFETVKLGHGNNQMPVVQVEHANCSGTIYLNGAHVTHFQPVGQEPILWMSSSSKFNAGEPIRGGIPLCWPWFGPAKNSSHPQHGFARIWSWDVESVRENNDGVEVRFSMPMPKANPFGFATEIELSYLVRMGKSFSCQLEMKNVGDQVIPEIGTALHSYFQVSHIDNVILKGLAGRNYIDQLQDHSIETQTDDVRISAEVDRVYTQTEETVNLIDSATGRELAISKTGSRSTVVWNPWIEKSARMADFPDDGYQTMVCVETANAYTDTRTLQPGELHQISQAIEIVN